MFGLGATELVIIFLIVVVLFGSSRIPKLIKSIGESIKELRKATKEIEKDDI